MSEIRFIIDGVEVSGTGGQTILAVAKENGIDIPMLCHDDRVEIRGACGICLVESEGNPRFLRACATPAANGMIIRTDTERLRKSRRATLELLFSDHTGDCRAPCSLACPAETDCQGYVKLIADGEYEKAYDLIKEKIPMPASIGRICPHPCEEACRRELVEEPISICALKQFAGDLPLQSPLLKGADIRPTGKKVAIIGGGPGGLSAAYYLRLKGHETTVFDSMPKMGGMLEYGVPEYRLPKKILQKEISEIEKNGVKFLNNVKIGRDISLEDLRKDFDAVIIAVGAWSSMGLRCPGENLDGVLSAVDFLKDVKSYDFSGRKIAVVGGGDIAMDACRTSVRLGAEKVYNIYRRTKNEMPANITEITEAEEEGIIFKNLTNPIEITGENGRVKSLRLQIMQLGEPDSSGRRSPVAIEGKEETLGVDFVIIAIGQKLDGTGFDEIAKTKWGTIIADENTFATNLNGVFAVGDATNKGADIAISAIGEARRAAEIIDKYLNGENLESLKSTAQCLSKTEKTRDDFSDKEKSPRAKKSHRNPDERRKDFLETNFVLTEKDAKKEASRCLECGCKAFSESTCKLINYANKYNAQPEKFGGEKNRRKCEDIQDFIRHNPEKCILCGLCVNICGDVAKESVLGFADRGFDTYMRYSFDENLCNADCCLNCGKCVEACPTGALERM